MFVNKDSARRCGLSTKRDIDQWINQSCGRSDSDCKVKYVATYASLHERQHFIYGE
jgi:hypothetical protein